MRSRWVGCRVAILVLAFSGKAAVADEAPDPIEKATSQFAKLDGHRIHYKSLGEGSTALVFIHGWTCDLTFWRAQAPAFVGKTRMVLIDLPGHGRSDKPKIEYSMDLFARAVDAVLQDAGVQTAALAGHSMGTPVARQFYRRFPRKTRAIIAVDGALKFLDKPEEFDKFVASLAGPDYQEVQSKMIDSMLPETMPAELRKSVKATMQRTQQHVAVSAMKAMGDPAIWKDDKVEVPLQVIAAKSPYWDAEYERYVRNLAPKLDYRVMEGVGHFLMLEKPEAFNAHLAAFLRREQLLKP